MLITVIAVVHSVVRFEGHYAPLDGVLRGEPADSIKPKFDSSD